MAGEIQLNSTTFASESSGTITVNNSTLASNVVFPTDHIIQIVTLQTTAQSSLANAAEFTSIRKSITPTATGSRLMVNYSFGHVGASTSADQGLAPIRSTDSGSNWSEFSVGSGGTRNVMFSQTDVGGAGGVTCSYTFIDPGVSTTAGSSIMYSIRAYTNTGTLYINRRGDDTTNAAISTITIFELAG